MNYSKSFKTCVFQKYATFKGTATRSEYWWFWLTYCCTLFGLPMLAFILDNMEIKLYFLMVVWAIGSIGLAVPFVAVSVRRLHDGGFNGLHFLWRAIPIVGSIITIVLMCQPSKQQPIEEQEQTSVDVPTQPNEQVESKSTAHSQYMPQAMKMPIEEQSLRDETQASFVTIANNALFLNIKSGLRAGFNCLKNIKNLFIKIVLGIIAIALWNIVLILENILEEIQEFDNNATHLLYNIWQSF